MVRLAYRPDMTLDVYRGRKRTTQQQQYSRARAYYTCSRGWCGLFGHFPLAYHISLSFLLLLWQTVRYRLKYCPKELYNPKQPTNHPLLCDDVVRRQIFKSVVKKLQHLLIDSGESKSTLSVMLYYKSTGRKIF